MSRMVIVYILIAAFTQAAIMNLPLQAQEAARGTVVRMDPELDKLVPPDAKVEKVHGDFGFIEGPVWVRSDGYLLFSDIPKNSIMKWTPDGKVVAIRTSIFAHRKPSCWGCSRFPRFQRTWRGETPTAKRYT